MCLHSVQCEVLCYLFGLCCVIIFIYEKRCVRNCNLSLRSGIIPPCETSQLCDHLIIIYYVFLVYGSFCSKLIYSFNLALYRWSSGPDWIVLAIRKIFIYQPIVCYYSGPYWLNFNTNIKLHYYKAVIRMTKNSGLFLPTAQYSNGPLRFS